MADEAPQLFLGAEGRKSDFFRDLAGAAYTAGAEALSQTDGVPFERVLSLYDRAILDVETDGEIAGSLPAKLSVSPASLLVRMPI